MTIHGNSRFACGLLFCSFVDNMAARSRGFGFACRAICMISFSSVEVSSYHQISLQFSFATVCNVSLKPAWSSKLCVRKWVGISSHRAEGVGATPRANVKSIHQESQGSGHIRLECTIWNPHEDEEDSTWRWRGRAIGLFPWSNRHSGGMPGTVYSFQGVHGFLHAKKGSKPRSTLGHRVVLGRDQSGQPTAPPQQAKDPGDLLDFRGVRHCWPLQWAPVVYSLQREKRWGQQDWGVDSAVAASDWCFLPAT